MECNGERKISLMFSGGVDSTFAATALAEEYDEVHLLTYYNGYGHYKIGRTGRRAQELKDRFPRKFRHSIISVQDIFEALVLDTLDEDYRRFRSGFVWCLGCKLSMHARSILYNLEHGISCMSDGSSMDTSEMVEQMLISVSMIRLLYKDYGIEFTTPVYEVSRDEERLRLKEMGFRMGIPVGNRYLGVQPKCKPGELYYLPYLLFKQPPKHDEGPVAEYIRDKGDQARRMIDARLDEAGIRRPEGPGRSGGGGG